MTDTALDPAAVLDALLVAYRRRIGDDGSLKATLATLTRVIERHAAAIAFENIDVLARRVPDLELSGLQRKLVNSRRGGYCFEQNRLLLACLRHIGFAVAPLEGRVRAGVPQDVQTGRTHMALRVSIDGEDWLADVGFGGQAPTAPLRIASRDPQRTPHGTYRLADAPHGERMLQIAADSGAWSDCYCVGAAEPRPIDQEIGNWYVATHPASMLRSNLLVGRVVDGGRLTLFNDELTLRSTDGSTQRKMLRTRSEFERVLRDDFGLELGPVEIDAVMRAARAEDRGPAT